ncbi:creatininase family protein [Halocalculus aciditolerans]|uniref:Creatininase n=1 Tax=Halocalculus aciditolerans TaxID=1383812 RepID=A0A830FFM9_9EURY|nr:creatininase family protein [Halocalculus aciditolerans]GGL70076.1 creatininase [Halocalculus aciditolerans]
MHLGDATWTDAADADPDVALLPVGSTEQHGPHAPLATDALTASAVADAAADRYDGELVVAPTLPVGVSEEHRDFPGTLWLTPDTFRASVRETIQSLVHHGWDRVIVVNGHGGNTDALAEVTATVSRHDDAYAVAFTWFDAVGDHSKDMGHAGPLETAFLRHVHPELVHEDRIEDAAAGASPRWGDWVAGVNLAHDSHEFSENGVVGDPRDGDAERGEELETLAADALVELARAVADRDLD